MTLAAQEPRHHFGHHRAIGFGVGQREEILKRRVSGVTGDKRVVVVDAGGQLLEIVRVQVKQGVAGECARINLVENAGDVGLVALELCRQCVGELFGAQRLPVGAHHHDQAVEVGELVCIALVVVRVAAVAGDQVVLSGAEFQTCARIGDRTNRKRNTDGEHQVRALEVQPRERAEHPVAQRHARFPLVARRVPRPI
jgi:hypothetical protein